MFDIPQQAATGITRKDYRTFYMKQKYRQDTYQAGCGDRVSCYTIMAIHGFTIWGTIPNWPYFSYIFFGTAIHGYTINIYQPQMSTLVETSKRSEEITNKSMVFPMTRPGVNKDPDFS
jgi:hypothetical protein